MALIKGLGFLAPTPRLAATLVNWRDGAPDAFHGANRMPPPVAGRPPGTRAPIDAVADYAVRLHATLGAEHAATSPLGAYLLLAAVGPAASGARRTELERTLGCPVDEAARFLFELLASPHPAIVAALAIWNTSVIASEAFERWRLALPPGLGTGAIPSQHEANAWAGRATQGMIARFPLEIGPHSVLVLSSALASRGPWQHPLDVVPAELLGSSPWARELKHALIDFAPDGQAIFWTRSAGLVGVSLARTTEALLVVSLIAEPGVAPHTAIAAAHEVAALVSGRASTAAYRSLFDLLLGAGHAWELVETQVDASLWGKRHESAKILIPAWRAESPAIDLMRDPGLGFAAAADTLFDHLPPIPEGYAAQAAQVTSAKFHRSGFSAAAVTALEISEAATGESRRPGPKTPSRHATVRFSRPFAVVAVAESPAGMRRDHGPQTGPPSGTHAWHGVPVFTAWVTRPSEPDEVERG